MVLQYTPLHELCRDAGGRMVPFAGWEMPLQFSGLLQEHQAVRKHGGMFDVSHMGVLRIEGTNPKDALQALVPTDLHRIGPGEACYTVLLNEKGGIVDDLVIYDIESNQGEKESLLIVINAACAETDTTWLKQHLATTDIVISDAKANGVLLAVQGPQTREVLESLSGESLVNLPRFGHRNIQFNGLGTEQPESVFIARTGYTGEDGFELLLDAKAGRALWLSLLAKGISPCGLGSRDTLRLEAAMHLYGQDMNINTTPFEAGLGWLVHLEIPAQFIGRTALEQQAEQGPLRRLIGLKLPGRAIARHGYPVLHNNEKVGEITSGTWSPTLGEAIAMAYVPTALAHIGNVLEVEIRGKNHPATVVKRPFYRRASFN
ncbi:MAG: glycine cleavage system aminomethyltransferase GcvT [Prochlorococcaceae cyanobacterium ETNP14_MAG_4]|nr:glycine cleavage system aminomethyltransferase GcvT [Prochlorococcaceae cyanobacterium ETNP14_MAG_4]